MGREGYCGHTEQQKPDAVFKSCGFYVSISFTGEPREYQTFWTSLFGFSFRLNIPLHVKLPHGDENATGFHAKWNFPSMFCSEIGVRALQSSSKSKSSIFRPFVFHHFQEGAVQTAPSMSTAWHKHCIYLQSFSQLAENCQVKMYVRVHNFMVKMENVISLWLLKLLLPFQTSLFSPADVVYVVLKSLSSLTYCKQRLSIIISGICN